LRHVFVAAIASGGIVARVAVDFPDVEGPVTLWIPPAFLDREADQVRCTHVIRAIGEIDRKVLYVAGV